MTLHVNTGKTQLPKTRLHCVICKNYYICFVYTRALESMLLVFFLLLIPRLCIRLGCRAGTDSGAKVWLEPHGTDDKCKPPMRADPVFLQDTLGSSLLFVEAVFYLLPTQRECHAMLPSLFHVCAFAFLVAVPPCWLRGWAAAWVHLQNPIFYGIWITAAKKLGHCSYFGEAEGCWGRNVPVLNLLNIVAASCGGFWTSQSLAGKGSAPKSQHWGVSAILEMCKASVQGVMQDRACGEDPAWHKLGGGGRTVILFWRMWCHFRHWSRILLKPALSLGKWHCRWWVSFQCNVILLLI